MEYVNKEILNKLDAAPGSSSSTEKSRCLFVLVDCGSLLDSVVTY